MAKRGEFIDFLVEQLAPLGEVRARAMFGGFGIYCGDRMFALVSDDTLYVKVDAATRAEFEAAGLRRFRPDSTKAEMPYFQIPTAAIDDRKLLCEWARKGVDAAFRAVRKNTSRRVKRR